MRVALTHTQGSGVPRMLDACTLGFHWDWPPFQGSGKTSQLEPSCPWVGFVMPPDGSCENRPVEKGTVFFWAASKTASKEGDSLLLGWVVFPLVVLAGSLKRCAAAFPRSP